MNDIIQSFQLELRVLENLMHFGEHSSRKVQEAMLKLTTDCFYNPTNAQFFGLIKKCFMKEEGFNFVDMLVIIPSEDLTLHDVLAGLVDNYRLYHTGEGSFESDVDKLLTLSTLRKQIQIAEGMIVQVKNCTIPADAQKILMDDLNLITALNTQESKQGISNFELADEYFEGNLQKDLIIPTSCEQLNEALGGGIMSKSLITIAAGAGVGKTGFAIFLLDCIARMQPDTQSLFFSLEMEAKHIWTRHVGICGQMLFEDMFHSDITNSVARSLEVPIKIYDAENCKSSADIDFILTTARLKAMEKKISVIVVDYLGLVENHGNFERNDLRQADITSKLARIAIELDCIVIALSQINRGASARASDDRCPYPHDAADSSGSHRSSTLWLGVDRPELYQTDPCYRNQFVIKCRKNRFGGIFELALAFNNGTFATVHEGFFKKPFAKTPIDLEKAIFYPDS
jgi:replicative DNA helicase